MSWAKCRNKKKAFHNALFSSTDTVITTKKITLTTRCLAFLSARASRRHFSRKTRGLSSTSRARSAVRAALWRRTAAAAARRAGDAPALTTTPRTGSTVPPPPRGRNSRAVISVVRASVGGAPTSSESSARDPSPSRALDPPMVPALDIGLDHR